MFKLKNIFLEIGFLESEFLECKNPENILCLWKLDV